MDKIQSSQGIDQVNPDTPSVLPDGIDAHPGDIAESNKTDCPSRHPSTQVREKQLQHKHVFEQDVKGVPSVKHFHAKWHICGDNLSSRAVSEGGQILSFHKTQLQAQEQSRTRRYSPMAHSQNPRAGKIQAHSPANC
jgi:hypothetical protein